MKKKPFCFLIPFILTLFITACSDEPLKDSRAIAKYLESGNYDYELDPEGDYKVVVKLEDNSRRDVWIRTELNYSGDAAVREIFSLGASLTPEESEYLGSYLLQDNFHTRVLGSWAYTKDPEREQVLAIYLIKLPLSVNPSIVAEALHEAAFAALVMDSVLNLED